MTKMKTTRRGFLKLLCGATALSAVPMLAIPKRVEKKEAHYICSNSNGLVGIIQTNPSGTIYRTLSDPRLMTIVTGNEGRSYNV